MNAIKINNNYQCINCKTEVRNYDINNNIIKEEVETAWFGDFFIKKVFYIERYKSDSVVMKHEESLEDNIKCNIQFKDIISYIRQWEYCTVKVVMYGDKIVQAFIYPNYEINSAKELLIFEICAGYGDEMFVRYDRRKDTFAPCGGVIGRKVSVALG